MSILRTLSIIISGCAVLATVWMLGAAPQQESSSLEESLPITQTATPYQTQSGSAPPQFTQRPHPQPASERTVRSGSWREVGAERPALINPRALRVSEGNVFFRDQSEIKVYRYTFDGEHVGTYGEGSGVGPKQHMNITGYGVASNGDVVIGDAQMRKISVFNEDGTLKRTERPDFGFLRLGITGNNQIVTLGAPTAVRFQPITGGEHQQGEDLVRDTHRWVGVLDGGLRGDSQGGAIQFSFYYGYLIRWHGNGSIDYIREMIGDYPPTPTEPAGATKRAVQSQIRFRVNDVSIQDDEVHVLLTFFESDENSHIVDVYNLRRGTYLYSYEPPKPLRSLAVSRDHIIGGQDTTFVVWDRSAVAE